MSALSTPIPSLPSAVQVDVGAGGLAVVRVAAPAGSAEIYLRGAHVASWTPTGRRPVIWMSEKSEFAPGVPLRGGVPICFPWFGANADDPTAPSHGFARLADWELVEAHVAGDTVVVTLRLVDSLATRAGTWDWRFESLYTVTVGDRLGLSLTVTNTDRKTFSYEDALHTYFAVSDIHSVSVAGLEDVAFLDRLDGPDPVPAEGEAVRFVGETDRIYLGTAQTITVVDPTGERAIEIEPAGSNSTVVWNPWVAKSAKMADFGDAEWNSMVCVETCNVLDSAITLAPGESHTTAVRYSVAD